ncbi:MAG: SpoIIE family protein phosphatase, partial [Oscillospiraceae bacterium]|nr:SpoIIE family protein phosphatase [Oscillospiraceae bacterium]
MRESRLHHWVGQAGIQAAGGVGKVAEKPWLRRAAHLTLRFAMGLLLSQAVILGGCAPFGVAFIAAAGTGVPGFLGLLGALGGYMFLWDLSGGLKYIAVCILVFAAGLVFRDIRAARRTLFMPLMALTASGFVGIVFLAADGFALMPSLLFAGELVLTGGSAYFFRIALGRADAPEASPVSPPLAMRRLISLLLLLSCLLLALSPVTLFGALSPARVATLLLVLLLAHRDGVGAGSAAGLATGAALDMASGTPFFSMAYGLAGLIGGAFQQTGKLACACAGVLVTAVAALWTPEGVPRLFVMLEAFLASVVFLLLPENTLIAFTALPARRAAEEMEQGRLRDQVRYRLSGSAAAFRALYESLAGAFSEPPVRPEEDTAVIFDRTADRVCKRCALLGLCWNRESGATFQALAEAAEALRRRGTLEATDFPAYFSARCLNFQRFVGACNEETAALMYRRQFRTRLHQSRLQVCRQYAELSRVLEGLAEEAGRPPSFDWEAEARVSRYLRGMGLNGRVAVSEDSARRLRVDIQGRGLSRLTGRGGRTARDLSTLLGVRLGQPDQAADAAGERLIFREADPLTAHLGLASVKKQGQPVSGDTGSYFRAADGRLAVLLSDGMGSGREASLASSAAAGLLERFLRAGIQPESALATLNAALALKGEETPGFVTVDLLLIDLTGGEAVFYKYGAAPTYVKRGRKVTRITGGTLPAGLADTGPKALLDVARMRLGHGEIVLLVSDGVADAVAD